MRSVLCISGLDPAGHSGLAADLRALSYLGIRALPVATALTVQNLDSFMEVNSVSAGILERQVSKVLEELEPDAVKVGMLGCAETASAVARMLGEVGRPIVVDPVLASSSGFTLADEALLRVYREELLPLAAVATPNAPEASILSGTDAVDLQTARTAGQKILRFGAGAVLIKGGHLPDSKGADILCTPSGPVAIEGSSPAHGSRGTGCAYSALIAGHMAMGSDVLSAVRRAKSDMTRVMESNAWQGYGGAWQRDPEETPDSQAMRALALAVSEMLSFLPVEFIAEVGNNMAYAMPGAKGPEHVCSLDSRILARGDSPATLGRPVLGRDSHVGRVVLAAMSHDPGMRCALNLRYSESLVRRIGKAGFSLAAFDRSGEPGQASSMEWGTGKAIKSLGYVPDAIYDLGSVGKEPMVRLLARDPPELLLKLRKILETET